jgi:hypothetical protein
VGTWKTPSPCAAPKSKLGKLPTKWRSAQEFYAEEQLSWNVSDALLSGDKTKSSTNEMYRAILSDVVRDWDKIADEKKPAFEAKAAGVAKSMTWNAWPIALSAPVSSESRTLLTSAMGSIQSCGALNLSGPALV